MKPFSSQAMQIFEKAILNKVSLSPAVLWCGYRILVSVSNFLLRILITENELQLAAVQCISYFHYTRYQTGLDNFIVGDSQKTGERNVVLLAKVALL